MDNKSIFRNSAKTDNSIELSKLLPKIDDFNFGIVLIGAYILFDFGAFQDMFSIISSLRIPYILAALSVFYALFLISTGRANLNSQTTRIFVALYFFICIYSIISTNSPVSKRHLLLAFTQYLANYFIIVSSIKRPSQFIALIDIWLAAIVLSSYHAIAQGGLIWASRWLRDENTVSLVGGYAIPFAFFLFINYRSRVKQLCYAIAIGFYVAIVLVSASRGGGLGFISVVFLCWLLSKHKLRSFLAVIMLFIIILAIAPSLKNIHKESFLDEMSTIVNEGIEENTAADRIYAWRISMNMFFDHPIFGVGVLNYPENVPKYDVENRYERRYLMGSSKVTHNTLLQWLSETGIVGMALLLLLQVVMYKNWKIVRNHKKDPSSSLDNKKGFYLFESLANAIAISEVGFWISALFLSLMIYPFYWILIPFSESWKNILVARFKIPEGGRLGSIVK